jgi:hypothetical protein
VDVPHAYELIREGAQVVHRELFESSLLAGRSVLEMLGCGAYEARELADRFRHANIDQLNAMATLEPATDRKEYVDRVRRSREELERQLRMEVLQPQGTRGWQQPKEREDS